MKPDKAMTLIKKYAICLECGDDNGEVQVLNDSFSRVCPCGWRVEVKVAENPEVQKMQEIQGKPPVAVPRPAPIATETLDGKPFDTWVQETNTEQGG